MECLPAGELLAGMVPAQMSVAILLLDQLQARHILRSMWQGEKLPLQLYMDVCGSLEEGNFYPVQVRMCVL